MELVRLRLKHGEPANMKYWIEEPERKRLYDTICSRDARGRYKPGSFHGMGSWYDFIETALKHPLPPLEETYGGRSYKRVYFPWEPVALIHDKITREGMPSAQTEWKNDPESYVLLRQASRRGANGHAGGTGPRYYGYGNWPDFYNAVKEGRVPMQRSGYTLMPLQSKRKKKTSLPAAPENPGGQSSPQPPA